MNKTDGINAVIIGVIGLVLLGVSLYQRSGKGFVFAIMCFIGVFLIWTFSNDIERGENGKNRNQDREM